MVDEIRGLAALDKLIHIDQNPIGNTPIQPGHFYRTI